ncbi:MAG: Rne/Rng family ribonuclease [Bacteroidales bacterium]|nr:Rne/Rng family ribonuclease [Bacteroidales bacterium]
MEKDLIIDVTAKETTIALLEDHRLSELFKELNPQDRQFCLGDVYFGKVKKLLPTLNAAFVDIGDKKEAFVHYLDLGLNFNAFDKFARGINPNRDFAQFYTGTTADYLLAKEGKIEDFLKVGQPIIVQIVKEPINTKGSRLSAEISIAGRNMVLLPFGDKVSISQKINSKEERKRLERLVCSILPANYGVIVRTAAQGKKAAVLDAELRGLVKKWESAWPVMAQQKTPKLLFTENNKTTAVLRDLLNDTFANIVVNDEETAHQMSEYISEILPEQEKIVHLYKGREPILDHYDVTRQIKSAFGKVVPIRQGAYLVIETTEALHVVDVNSGTRVKTGKDQEQNAFDVNCNAAEEIARQLKLRDMGGIVIVDFIDMDSAEHRAQLLKNMQELMKNDRAKHNILPLTKFGLMQITRQRVRPATEIETEETCPTCGGTGKVSSSILIDQTIERSLIQLLADGKRQKLVLKTNPLVEAYLTKGLLNSIVRRWKKTYKCSIKVDADDSLHLLDFEWFAADGKKISEKK